MTSSLPVCDLCENGYFWRRDSALGIKDEPFVKGIWPHIFSVYFKFVEIFANIHLFLIHDLTNFQCQPYIFLAAKKKEKKISKVENS